MREFHSFSLRLNDSYCNTVELSTAKDKYIIFYLHKLLL
jgi:hypothetical protein